MKTLAIALISGLALSSMAANAGQYQFVAGNNSLSTQLCVAAASNHLMQYNNKAASSGYSKRHIAQTTTCNGINIGSFAEKYDAQRTAKQINRYRTGNIIITDYAGVTPSQSKELTIVTIN